MVVPLGREVVAVVRLTRSAMNLRVVIPVYNEGISLLPWLRSVVSYLADDDCLVLVDASDENHEGNIEERMGGFLSDPIFQQANVFYVRSDKGRAIQMNAGADFLMFQNKMSDGFIWFLHSDSGLSGEHFSYLRALKSNVLWGRFDVRLSAEQPFGFANSILFSIKSYTVSKFINVRSRLTQVMTGDQGIFVRSDVFQDLGGYDAIPLMEDVEISKRLRALGKADCNGPVLLTSARRWQKHGWLKTVLLMWQLRFLYWRGVSPKALVKKYYG